jgi:hypothetical protein
VHSQGRDRIAPMKFPAIEMELRFNGDRGRQGRQAGQSAGAARRFRVAGKDDPWGEGERWKRRLKLAPVDAKD